MRTGVCLAVTAKRNRRSTTSDLSLQLSSATGTTVSRQTVYRRLGQIGLYAPRPIASDSRRTLIWRALFTRYHQYNTIKRHHCGGAGWLVWGGIILGSRTDLHVQSVTMTGLIYRDVILEQHVRLFRGAMGAEFLFMDDNAHLHRANIVDECLQSEDINRMDWLAYSPDLNAIEQAGVAGQVDRSECAVRKLLGAMDTGRYPRAENRVWSDQEDHKERGSKDRAASTCGTHSDSFNDTSRRRRSNCSSNNFQTPCRSKS
ncbi:transposable element Tcb1 transposase [Trichonephila clavipes]|nr:transposable element Tcb1 transposase [Trichonephila clavipes]